MRLLLVRHAATSWNEQRRMQGRSDPSLSDAGRASLGQIRLPAPWRTGIGYASPLRRARETAAALGVMEPRPVAALIEMSWGEWEGQTLASLRAAQGEAMARNEARGLDFRPTGGESPREVGERVLAWMAGRDDDEIAWAVTHKGVIRSVYAFATGWDMRRDPPDRLDYRCGHAFVHEAGRLRVERLNVPLVSPPGAAA